LYVLQEKRKEKREVLIFKVDFEKTYDSVDWRMRFNNKWRGWIAEIS
jgi:hypothetical protein